MTTTSTIVIKDIVFEDIIDSEEWATLASRYHILRRNAKLLRNEYGYPNFVEEDGVQIDPSVFGIHLGGWVHDDKRVDLVEIYVNDDENDYRLRTVGFLVNGVIYTLSYKIWHCVTKGVDESFDDDELTADEFWIELMEFLNDYYSTV
jgi:hypothetical protein